MCYNDGGKHKGAVNSLKSSTNILLLEFFTSQNLVLNNGTSDSSLLKDTDVCSSFAIVPHYYFLGKRQSLTEDLSSFHLAVSISYFHSNIIVTLSIHSINICL